MARTDIHTQFTGAMLDIYRRALRETGYRATRFLQMVTETSGYEVAMQLVHAPRESEGYTELHQRGRLDLSVEAVVLNPKWAELFTDEDRAAARKRLVAYEFDFKKYGL
jgi:hypothetical protein